jgi:hypothetical protein
MAVAVKITIWLRPKLVGLVAGLAGILQLVVAFKATI